VFQGAGVKSKKFDESAGGKGRKGKKGIDTLKYRSTYQIPSS